MTLQESRAINFVRFICIIALVLLHTRVVHLSAPTIAEPLGRVQNLISLPFLPILFLISSYLFFYKKKRQTTKHWVSTIWPTKLRKRVKSLLIPYAIWCAIAIAYNHFVKQDPLPSGIRDWLIQFWDAGSGHPIGKAMWYIKSLMVFSLLAPLYYYAVKLLKHTTLVLVMVLIVVDVPIDYPYFSNWLLLGSYLAIMNISFCDIVEKLDWRICLIFYLLLKLPPIAGWHIDISTFALTLCCFAALFGLGMRHSISSRLAATSSFVYFLHPYIQGVRNIFIKLADTSSLLQCTMTWLITAATVLVVCIGLFILMKKFTPRILAITTGDRI